MPYSITTKDGITINNIPDDVPPDAQELKDRVAAIRAGGGASALEAPQEPQTTAGGLLGAVVRGAGPTATGAALGALAGGVPTAGIGAIPGAMLGAGTATVATFVGDPVIEGINALLGTNYETPTQSIQALFDRLGVPQAQTEAERIVQTAAQAGSGAAGSAALARQIAQVAPAMSTLGASAQQMAAQPAQQIVGGAAAGGASQATAEAGGGPVEQLLAGLAGGVLGAKVAGTTMQPANPAALPADLATAQKQGVRVMTTDVVPPRTFAARWLQGAGEKIPVAGTGGAREAQQGERVNAVRSLLRDFGADDVAAASDDVMVDLARKRSALLQKHSGMKTEVIDRLNTSGPVPLQRTTAAIDKKIAELESLRSTEQAPLISMLQDFKDSIQGQGLRNVEELRKQLGDSLAQNPNLAAVKTRGEKAARDIYRVLVDDMGDHIKATGQPRDFAKWKIANRNLADLADDMKMGALERVLKKGNETPEVVKNMLFSAKPSEVKALYRGLTPAGKAAARTAILQRAAEKAGGMENISPDKFANEVGRLGRSVGVFFDGDELRRVNGLVRVLNITKRAGQAGVNPPTGQQAVPILAADLLSTTFGGPMGATVGAATIGGLARIYESAPVRNLLIQVAQVPKGSPEEAALVKRTLAAIQAQQSTTEQPQ